MVRFALAFAAILAGRPAEARPLPVPPMPPHPLARWRPPAVRTMPLPIPPLPPQFVFGAAPVPDADAAAPHPAAHAPGLSAEPAFFDLPPSFHGDGYPYGASPQGLHEQRATRVPGVRLTLPLP